MHAYDHKTVERDGVTYRVEWHYDDHSREPWKECESHGPVSDWTTRGKRPGERVLSKDGCLLRYYDFEEACRIARRDGWGTLPEPLKLDFLPGDWKPYQTRGGTASSGPYSAFDGENINRAISAVYDMHRKALGPRAYAAAAAEADFKRLKAWCDDEWHWCGVVVRRADACPRCGPSESLWSIESDAGDYFDEVIDDLIAALADNHCADAA